MKKILLIFLAALTANAVTAQTVYTPNGTAIDATLHPIGTGIHANGKKPFELEAISDLLTITLNPIEYEGSYPLDTYNCHGFAFYMQGSPSHDPAAWIDESTVYVIVTITAIFQFMIRITLSMQKLYDTITILL